VINVKVVQILGHHLQGMLQASLSSVLVMNYTKHAYLQLDVRIVGYLGWLDRVAGAHAVVFGWVWQVELVLMANIFAQVYWDHVTRSKLGSHN
jgi:hypothetical protein